MRRSAWASRRKRARTGHATAQETSDMEEVRGDNTDRGVQASVNTLRERQDVIRCHGNHVRVALFAWLEDGVQASG